MIREEIIYKHLNRLKENIIKEMRSLGMINTGGAINSLEVEENKLLGNNYLYYLVYGSKPWKNPENYKYLGILLKDAGWNKTNPFAAAYKIANEGSSIYRGERKRLDLERLIDDMLNELYEDIAENEKIEILKFL